MKKLHECQTNNGSEPMTLYIYIYSIYVLSTTKFDCWNRLVIIITIIIVIIIKPSYYVTCCQVLIWGNKPHEMISTKLQWRALFSSKPEVFWVYKPPQSGKTPLCSKMYPGRVFSFFFLSFPQVFQHLCGQQRVHVDEGGEKEIMNGWNYTRGRSQSSSSLWSWRGH